MPDNRMARFHDGSIPSYTQPGTRVGGTSFTLEGAEFTHAGALLPSPAARQTAYARYVVGTAYIIPFVFDPASKGSLPVFLAPVDYDLYWMFGGEVAAGEPIGDTLVHYLREQGGIEVSDKNRTRFLDMERVWDIMRHVQLRDGQPPVVRHEFARVFGYALAADEMGSIELPGSSINPKERWIDILAPVGAEFVGSELDPALRAILPAFATKVLQFHRFM